MILQTAYSEIKARKLFPKANLRFAGWQMMGKLGGLPIN